MVEAATTDHKALVHHATANVRPTLSVAKGDILPLGPGGEPRLLVEKVEVKWTEGKNGQHIKLTIEGVQV